MPQCEPMAPSSWVVKNPSAGAGGRDIQNFQIACAAVNKRQANPQDRVLYRTTPDFLPGKQLIKENC